MRFARPTAVTLAVGWLMAACRYGPARAVPSKPSEGRSFRIEDVYRHFRGPESGIMVRRENLLSVMGYSVDRFPEPDAARNHYRPRTCFERVRFLVVHITDNADLEDTLRLYTANGTGNQMSAHYVVAKSTEADTDQMLIRVVPENQVAYHAGKSAWGRYRNLDSLSIGISIVNMGHRQFLNWDKFHSEQINVVGLLLARLCLQYNISSQNVVAHADIAPHRRYDPGVMFPWRSLYINYGVGASFDAEDLAGYNVTDMHNAFNAMSQRQRRRTILEYLHEYGYDVSDGDAAIKAFKAHFSANNEPALYNADLNQNDVYWAWALVTKYVNNNKTRS